jgi:adenosylcobinamide-phosphate synthase
MVTSEMMRCGVILAAMVVDYLVGDPWEWYHPVRAIGEWIGWYGDRAIAYIRQPRWLKLAGIILCIVTISGTGFISWGLIRAADEVSVVAGWLLQVVMLGSCLAARSLRRAAMDVVEAIDPDDLAPARAKLSLYVGRDTDRLSADGIYRSILETVTENATDGVMAPLFYAICGAMLPIGPVPLAMAYKAASTLDSMVGYRRAPYTDLGWCSAKCEDLLTWLPCRLTVLSIALISGNPRTVWQLCWRDAPHDPSPNSGWSECAYAAALGVRLGGDNYYRGELKFKPFLGDDLAPITPATIDRALAMTRSCVLIWGGIGCCLLLL